MQSFNIIKKISAIDTFRNNKIIGMFDLRQENYTQEFHGDIDLPEKWNIGLIVGRSGTGKSLIAKELFGISTVSYTCKTIVDEMPENKTVEEITGVFTNCGFSSPPSWLKQYSMLSNGEKMRVDLAKLILSDEELIVFDEFTSVVDRDVAKICSMVINKSIKKYNKKFIAVTCHHDVEEWLQPDWVFNTDKMEFSLNDGKKKDQKSNCQFTRDNTPIGNCLKIITI